jgi:hypothetical protein
MERMTHSILAIYSMIFRNCIPLALPAVSVYCRKRYLSISWIESLGVPAVEPVMDGWPQRFCAEADMNLEGVFFDGIATDRWSRIYQPGAESRRRIASARGRRANGRRRILPLFVCGVLYG